MVVRDIGNPFYLDVVKGVEAAARAAGYAVLMGNAENDPERETEFFDMLRDGHADGMILMTGSLPSTPDFRRRLSPDLPVVAWAARMCRSATRRRAGRRSSIWAGSAIAASRMSVGRCRRR